MSPFDRLEMERAAADSDDDRRARLAHESVAPHGLPPTGGDDTPVPAPGRRRCNAVEVGSMLDHALALVEASGARVFPLYTIVNGHCSCPDPDGCEVPAKHPMLARWQVRASSDPDIVRAMWARSPNANIGIACGRGSGIVVLDIDGSIGEESLAALEREHGALPNTVQARTSRGRHFYFAHPGGDVAIKNSSGTIGTGIDLRADGGYAVSPPSLHESGHVYRWEVGQLGDTLAPMPAWLAVAPTPRNTIPVSPPSAAPRLAEVPSAYGRTALDRECRAVSGAAQGSRNHTLNAAAFNLGTIVRQGLLDASAVRIGLKSAALSAGLEELEIKRTLESGLSAGLGADPRQIADRPRPMRAAANGNGHSSPHTQERSAQLDPIEFAMLPAGVVPGSDLSTASLLTAIHGDDLLYCVEPGKWHDYDGVRYRPDSYGRVSLRVQHIARRLESTAGEIEAAAATLEDKTERQAAEAFAKSLSAWARHAQSATGIAAAMKVAQTHLACSMAALDADPLLLNVLNGTIELATGTLREHRRSDRMAKLAPVAFDANAAAPRFQAFIAEILPDAKLREFVQRFLGYTLSGMTSEQMMLVALGGGANGKSVLAELMRTILGDYAGNLPSDALMISKHGRGTENDLARLAGARFVTAKETDRDKRLDEARTKDLTGGDTISARFLFREWFDFKPLFKLFFYSNHRPRIVGTDHAIWRRLALVTFGVTIPTERRDKDLLSKLVAEAPGVLNWLVEGCLAWQRGGLQPPAAVLAATAEWEAESDDVPSFISERCVRLPRARVKAADLYAAYAAWFAAEGRGADAALTAKAFGQRLAALGFEAKRTSSARYWQGLGLVAAEADRNTDEQIAGDDQRPS
jgi:putative DNA primase/helicase